MPGDPAPEPLPARDQSEIVADWRSASDAAPRVSIVCATYQHRLWIEDALRGFLGQRTTFPFEVLIRDDASTDGTADVVRDYARRYPSIIRAWIEEKNTWPDQRTAFLLQPRARGQLIAYCEGDDYWADSGMLAAHVAAFDADPTLAISHVPAVSVRDGLVLQNLDFRGDWTSTDALPHFPGIPLSALCARNVPVPVPPMQHRISSLDRFHLSVYAHAGRSIRVADAGPAVYRKHEGGTWSTLQPVESAARVAESYAWIARWWREQGNDELAAQFELAAMRRLASVLPGVRARVRRRNPGWMSFRRLVGRRVRRVAPGLHDWVVRRRW